ncbi:MAG: hypothetical protein ABIG44_06385 [Planctomycetota bacterium]
MTRQISNWWRILHSWAWWRRWILKWVVLLIVVGVVLYPKLWLLPRQINRLRNVNAVLQPDLPALHELEQAARQAAGPDPTPQVMLAVVQKVVYRHVPYAWDWEVWGVMDYLPTVEEVLEHGREDCDGRAVVAASLLCRMGYEAWLVSDIGHMWVRTSAGETMSPGKGTKTIEGGAEGTQIRWTIDALENLSRALIYGLSVFPLTRELIILVAVCGLTMHPRSTAGRRWAGGLLMLLGLGLLHDAGSTALGQAGLSWRAWLGMLVLLSGWILLALRVADSHSPATEPQ